MDKAKFTFHAENCQQVFIAKYLQSFKQRGAALPDSGYGLSVFHLRDCLYLGDNSQVLLPVHGAGTLPFILLESCPYKSNEQHLSPIAQSQLEQLENGNSGSLQILDEAAPLCPPGASNLWHWLTESLPKLLALEAAGFKGLYITPQTAVVSETFDLLGIERNRCVSGTGAYLIKNAFIGQRLSGFDLPAYMKLTAALRKQLLEPCGQAEGSKRVYIKRIGRRKIMNETEVLNVLNDFGFAVLLPEKHSLKEQIHFMSNAECSVMGHGANSTLTLFQKPHSTFIELFGNRYVSYNNLHAARLLKLRYHPLVEDLELASCPADSNMPVYDYLLEGYDKDFIVDVDNLRIMLEACCQH